MVLFNFYDILRMHSLVQHASTYTTLTSFTLSKFCDPWVWHFVLNSYQPEFHATLTSISCIYLLSALCKLPHNSVSWVTVLTDVRNMNEKLNKPQSQDTKVTIRSEKTHHFLVLLKRMMMICLCKIKEPQKIWTMNLKAMYAGVHWKFNKNLIKINNQYWQDELTIHVSTSIFIQNNKLN